MTRFARPPARRRCLPNLQAGSTRACTGMTPGYEHHEGTVRGASRAERNMLRTVTGDFGRLDRNTLDALSITSSRKDRGEAAQWAASPPRGAFLRSARS